MEKKEYNTYLGNEDTPSDTEINTNNHENEINNPNIFIQPEQEEDQDNGIDEEDEDEDEDEDEEIEAIQQAPIVVENQGTTQSQKYQFTNEGQLYEVDEKGQLFKVTTEIQNGQEVQIYEQVGGSTEQNTTFPVEVAKPIIYNENNQQVQPYQNNYENQQVQPIIYQNNYETQQYQPIIQSQEIQENQNYNIPYETFQSSGQNMQYPILQNYQGNYPNLIQNQNTNPLLNFNGNIKDKKEKVPMDSHPKSHLPSRSQNLDRFRNFNLNSINISNYMERNSRDDTERQIYIKKNGMIKYNNIKGKGRYYNNEEEFPTDTKVKSNIKLPKGKNKNSITSKPTDKFSIYLLEQINKIRRDPESFAGVIEEARTNIKKDRFGRIIYNGKLKIVLSKGESAFLEAIKYLKNLDSMKPLEYVPKLTVLPPQNEREIKDKRDLGRKVEKMIDSGIKIKSYWKDVINDPEICCLLMIVDDNGINTGKKRKDILSPYMKYIGISSVNINKDFACYITLSNSLV